MVKGEPPGSPLDERGRASRAGRSAHAAPPRAPGRYGVRAHLPGYRGSGRGDVSRALLVAPPRCPQARRARSGSYSSGIFFLDARRPAVGSGFQSIWRCGPAVAQTQMSVVAPPGGAPPPTSASAGTIRTSVRGGGGVRGSLIRGASAQAPWIQNLHQITDASDLCGNALSGDVASDPRAAHADRPAR